MSGIGSLRPPHRYVKLFVLASRKENRFRFFCESSAGHFLVAEITLHGEKSGLHFAAYRGLLMFNFFIQYDTGIVLGSIYLIVAAVGAIINS